MTVGFAKVSIKGEGMLVGVILLSTLPLWIADQVRNDGPGRLFQFQRGQPR